MCFGEEYHISVILHCQISQFGIARLIASSVKSDEPKLPRYEKERISAVQ